MAGEFRTTFDFLETVGFTAGFTPDAPYQSWATEKVDVIEDSGERIVLQHVIVMQYIDESGAVQGPFVQKHWRQEWVYEDRSIHAYVGHDRWSETRFGIIAAIIRPGPRTRPGARCRDASRACATITTCSSA